MYVRSAARWLPGGGRGRRCADGWAGSPGERDACREGGAGAGRQGFCGAVLGPGHPCRDDAALLVGELFGNSVRHSGSGAPGGTVTVAVRAGDGVVRVEVADRGGPGAPKLRPADRDAEGGRGLQLVRASRGGGAGGGAAGGRSPGSSYRAGNIACPAAAPLWACLAVERRTSAATNRDQPTARATAGQASSRIGMSIKAVAI